FAAIEHANSPDQAKQHQRQVLRMKTPLLGIMALYMNKQKQLEEKKFFAKLIVMGRKMGLQPYVYTPEDVDGGKLRIYAHCYDPAGGGWHRKWMPFPDIIF